MSARQSPVCGFCQRPIEVCHVPVDHRFPEAAREAYQLAGLPTAATCTRGKAADMKLTQHGRRLGWSIDRAVGHPGWMGDVPSGVDPKVTANRKHRRPTPHMERDRLEKELGR